MGAFTRDSGRIIKWKEKESSNGLMDVATRESISTTRKKARAFFTGPTVANTMENGTMASSTEQEATQQPLARPNKARGRKESVQIGFDFWSCFFLNASCKNI